MIVKLSKSQVPNRPHILERAVRPHALSLQSWIRLVGIQSEIARLNADPMVSCGTTHFTNSERKTDLSLGKRSTV